MIVRPLPQRFAQRGDVLRQIGLGDEGVRPDRLDQIVFLHHLPAPLQQDQEDREGLWRERDLLVAAQQAAADRVHPEATELVQGSLSPCL